jgi:hypothetical protein
MDPALLCEVCERPVDDSSSHIVLARSGEEPRLVHAACLDVLRKVVGA